MKTPAEHQPINLRKKLALFTDHWSPKIVARMNDYDLRLAKLEGEFPWHSHRDTDEVFLILHGSLELHFRDGLVSLSEGDLYVVPKGVEHKPVAQAECHVLLVEPSGTENTGDGPERHEPGARPPAPTDEWI